MSGTLSGPNDSEQGWFVVHEVTGGYRVLSVEVEDERGGDIFVPNIGLPPLTESQAEDVAANLNAQSRMHSERMRGLRKIAETVYHDLVESEVVDQLRVAGEEEWASALDSDIMELSAQLEEEEAPEQDGETARPDAIFIVEEGEES